MKRAGMLQKEVAERWIARLSALGAPNPTRRTVASQLSRLLRREEKSAIRFFFRSAASGAALFDSFGVPDWEREVLLATVEAHLGDVPGARESE
jgi:hypothetical protein